MKKFAVAAVAAMFTLFAGAAISNANARQSVSAPNGAMALTDTVTPADTAGQTSLAALVDTVTPTDTACQARLAVLVDTVMPADTVASPLRGF